MICSTLRRQAALRFVVCGLLFVQLIVPGGLVLAQEGGVVVAGSATITQDGAALNVLSQSDRTIINWDGFSVGAGQSANFLQPSASSTVLNRVVSPNNPSLIYGQLNSNGNVILVNPSGIVVGPTGVINTNGFTASVLDIPDLEFLRGGSLTFRGDSTASVINQGVINTGPGGAALIGGSVINEGTITSYGGSISLVTGGSVTLADGSRFTHADLATIEMGLSPYVGVIQNSGAIRATGAVESGGEVYLVNPGGDIMHDGTIAALKTIDDQTAGGSVMVDASQGGQATLKGQIDASGEVGGQVTVQADEVSLLGALIDVSGVNGGGSARIGGGFQGNDPSIANALTTSVDADSIIRADAISLGNGGDVIIWSDNSTSFAGLVSARGGTQSGDGGLVEVSGSALAYQGNVDTTAANGATGWLLLDPIGIEVISGPVGPFLIAPSPVLTLTDGTLNSQLATSNVLLATAPSRVIYKDASSTLTAFVNNDDNIVISDGTAIDTGSNTLFLSTSTLDLYSTISGNVSGGIGSPLAPTGVTLKDPTTVNVFDGTTTIGSIDQAIGIVADGGTIGIGAGSFSRFTVDRAGLTIQGQGASTIINAASPAVTIAANNTTLQNMSLLGTGSAGDVGVLLDGFASPNLTGISIINVDIANMDDGIVSRGFIGVGAAPDVLIRGNSAGDKALFEDFLGSALVLGDFNLDAVYAIENVIIQDGSDGDTVSTGADAIQFNLVGSATLDGVDISDAGGHGVQFGAVADLAAVRDSSIEAAGNAIRFNSFGVPSVIRIQGNTLTSTGDDAIRFRRPLLDRDVLIGGPSLADGNQILGAADGIRANSIIDGSFVVANNSLIQGSDDAMQFDSFSTFLNTSVSIVGNQEIRGGDEGILFGGSIISSLVSIGGNDDIFGDGRDAIRFARPIATSAVTIGPSLVLVDGNPAFFGGNGRIIGADDAINIDSLTLSALTIVGNDQIEGNGGSGIEFDDTISSAAVTVAVNGLIRGSQVGVEFDTSIADSIVTIAANDFILGDLSDAIQFGDSIDNSLIVIGGPIPLLGNGQISGGSDGIEFTGPISGNNTLISIANNDSILGDFRGIAFNIGATIDDASVIIRANDIEGATGDAVLFNAALTNANILVGGLTPLGGNQILGGAEGIDVEDIDGGTFTVINNDIVSGGDGIEFEDDITSDAIVSVISNQILAGGDGIQFDTGSSIVDSALVNLIDNQIQLNGATSTGILVRNVGSSNPLTIQGGTIDDGVFGIVVVQSAGTGLDGHVIVDGVVINQPTNTGLRFATNNAVDTLEVTLQNMVTVNGGGSATDIGLVFDGLGLSVTGNTLNDTRFAGINGNFIELRNGGLFEPGQPTLIDATGVYFNGLDPTIGPNFTEITLRIIDYLDDPTLGLIFPGAPEIGPVATYDRFTRYEDYFRTSRYLLGRNGGIIRYPAPIIDVAEELEEQGPQE